MRVDFCWSNLVGARTKTSQTATLQWAVLQQKSSSVMSAYVAVSLLFPCRVREDGVGKQSRGDCEAMYAEHTSALFLNQPYFGVKYNPTIVQDEDSANVSGGCGKNYIVFIIVNNYDAFPARIRRRSKDLPKAKKSPCLFFGSRK